MTLYIFNKDGLTFGALESELKTAPQFWFKSNVPDYVNQSHRYGYTQAEDIDCHDVEPLLTRICERVGLTMTAEFVPFSKSRHAKPANGEKPWRSLNWRVTIARKGSQPLTTDYSKGEGHCPASKLPDKMFASAQGPVKRAREEAIAWEIENGKKADYYRWGITGKEPILPTIGEVISSLARDADVIDYGNFANWASDYGYDEDSRHAEKIYRLCIEHALALRAMVGDEVLKELQTVARFN